jgi:hypothetical protein
MNTPTLSLIATVYPEIAEPPIAGSTQVIVTLMFVFTEVDGAAGTLGGPSMVTVKVVVKVSRLGAKKVCYNYTT